MEVQRRKMQKLLMQRRIKLASAVVANEAGKPKNKRPIPHVSSPDLVNKKGQKKKSLRRKKKKVKNAKQEIICGTTRAGNERDQKLSELQQRMKAKLEGSRFRDLNEHLYTCSGSEAFKKFSRQPKLFEIYHSGFRAQVEKWPSNPLNGFIQFLQKRPKLIVGDFGCGDAVLAASVKNRVYSFDLVAVNDRVIACDIAKVPLEANCLDVAIFSLSLMGTNFMDFIREAHRALKNKGIMKIAEVSSRFKQGVDVFVTAVESIGFRCVRQNHKNSFFSTFDFVKHPKSIKQSSSATGPSSPLKSKKRNRKERAAKSAPAGSADARAKKKRETQHTSPIGVDKLAFGGTVLAPCIYKRR